jgi:hypothetical protein
LEVRKGPYFADIGDFANAGDLHLSLRDSVPKNVVSITVGGFGYDRFLALGSTKLGDGSLLYAGEFNTDSCALLTKSRSRFTSRRIMRLVIAWVENEWCR